MQTLANATNQIMFFSSEELNGMIAYLSPPQVPSHLWDGWVKEKMNQQERSNG